MRYFAYGSNMSASRIEERLGRCRSLGAGRLAGYALRFHKRGRDGSGKCDVVSTRAARDEVHGVVYELDAVRRLALDRIEGVGYASVELEVEIDSGTTVAFAYAAHPHATEPGLRPFTWYKALVVHGAREHALPAAYVRALEAVEALEDPDAERAARHWRLLAAPGSPP